TSSAPNLPPWRQSLWRPSRQNSHVPSDQRNGDTTRSPAFTVRTSGPTSSTTPTNSCPMRRPAFVGSIDLYGHRSLPQIAARLTRTSASVGSMRWASGTFSTRTSPAPYMSVARILWLPPGTGTVAVSAYCSSPDIADAYATGLHAAAVHAERKGLREAVASVAAEDAERVEIDGSGFRVPRRGDTATDVTRHRDERLADADGLAEPRVLDMRVEPVDLEQHAEAPAVDGSVRSRFHTQTLERSGRNERHAGVPGAAVRQQR